MILAELVERARPKWWHDAACATPRSVALIAAKRASWFPERGRSAGVARQICADCPVRRQCLDVALAEPFLAGIWGGTSQADRRAMRERAA